MVGLYCFGTFLLHFQIVVSWIHMLSFCIIGLIIQWAYYLNVRQILNGIFIWCAIKLQFFMIIFHFFDRILKVFWILSYVSNRRYAWTQVSYYLHVIGHRSMVAERTRYRLFIDAHGLGMKRVWRILDCSHVLNWNGCQMLFTIWFIIHSIIKRQSPCCDRSIYILWILCCQFPHRRIWIWRRRFLSIKPWNIRTIIGIIAPKQTPLTGRHWPAIIYIIGHLFHIIK